MRARLPSPRAPRLGALTGIIARPRRCSARNAAWGVRDIDDVTAEATAAGLVLETTVGHGPPSPSRGVDGPVHAPNAAQVDMPSNNKLVVFAKPRL